MVIIEQNTHRNKAGSFHIISSCIGDEYVPVSNL